MSAPSHILFVAPNPYFRIAREETLQHAGYRLSTFASASEALDKIGSNNFAFDLMILCDSLAAEQRGHLIAMVKVTSPHIPVLVIGDTRDRLADGVVSDLDGPEALLDHITALLPP